MDLGILLDKTYVQLACFLAPKEFGIAFSCLWQNMTTHKIYFLIFVRSRRYEQSPKAFSGKSSKATLARSKEARRQV